MILLLRGGALPRQECSLIKTELKFKNSGCKGSLEARFLKAFQFLRELISKLRFEKYFKKVPKLFLMIQLNFSFQTFCPIFCKTSILPRKRDFSCFCNCHFARCDDARHFITFSSRTELKWHARRQQTYLRQKMGLRILLRPKILKIR